MPVKRKKKPVKKASKATVKASPKSGIITVIVIAALVVAAAAAAAVVVAKFKPKTAPAGSNGEVLSTVSPASIKITDTATGKTSTMEVLPASAGSVKPATSTASAPAVNGQAAAVAQKVSDAAKTGDFTYLFGNFDTKETIPHIDIAEAKFLYDSGKALFVDARGPNEYTENHVKGAVNIPVAATPEELDKLKSKLKGRVLVTYCHGVGCHLADKTAYKLWDAGYRKIAIFFGGWPKWEEHKYPDIKN
jgi:rhodanese-related sulfurtransferase